MTAVESVSRPDIPRLLAPIDEHFLAAELPADVFSWRVEKVSRRLSRRGLCDRPDQPPAQVIAREFILKAVAGYADPSPVFEKVQIFAVRADGSLVFHDAILGDTRTHRPRSVFKVLGQGNFARFKFFANSELFGARWPPSWKNIPGYPGVVLILTYVKDHEVPTRHVFICPEDVLDIWTGGHPVPPPPPVPSPQRSRRRSRHP